MFLRGAVLCMLVLAVLALGVPASAERVPVHGTVTGSVEVPNLDEVRVQADKAVAARRAAQIAAKRADEAEGKFVQAKEAYERAKDLANKPAPAPVINVTNEDSTPSWLWVLLAVLITAVLCLVAVVIVGILVTRNKQSQCSERPVAQNAVSDEQGETFDVRGVVEVSVPIRVTGRVSGGQVTSRFRQ